MRLWRSLQLDLKAHSYPPTFKYLLIGYIASSGLSALIHFRIAAILIKRGRILRALAAVLARRSMRINCCDIRPTALIEAGVFLPHTIGIVIGADAVIEAGSIIYQNVTIGQKNGGYPHIGQNVIVYPGSVVVGSIVIGSFAVIGANSFVDRNVEPGTIFVGNGKTRRDTGDL